MRPRLALWLLVALLPTFAACAAPIPSHMVRLWPLGRTDEPLLGLSTEEGVLILTEPNFDVGDMFNIQFPKGNSGLVDLGTIDRLNDDLALVEPLYSRLATGRLATAVPNPRETLFLAVRDDEDQPVMMEVEAWKGGRFGNYIRIPGEGNPQRAAAELAGSGLYVYRDDRWQIVGMMAGITASLPGTYQADAGMGYLGLVEIGRILPDPLDYFERGDIKPLRPDLEFGVPLQPGDIVLPVPEEDEESPRGP